MDSNHRSPVTCELCRRGLPLLPARERERFSAISSAPSAGFLPRIAQRIKLPTSVWNSVAPLASSRAKARASVIGDTGLPVRGLVIVLQIRSSGIPSAFICLT